jgi:hypothetical protein
MAAGSFAVKASNVTMPAKGDGTSSYTVTGIPEPGTLTINCTNYGPIDPTTKVPICWTGLPQLINVAPGQTVTGTVSLVPFGHAVPAMTGAWIWAPFALLMGAGLSRKGRRWLSLAMVVVAMGGAAALSGCGGNPNAMTPGTYTYQLNAVLNPVGEAPTLLTSTTFTVTVP